jgi:hypothetical protein
VGLVPVSRTSIDQGLTPNALATVLSLSLRDGLSGGRHHIWPWLLAIQLVLWTGIAGYYGSRRLRSSLNSRRG